VVENTELDKKVRRNAASTIKAAALTTQLRFVAKVANDVEDMFNGGLLLSSSASASGKGTLSGGATTTSSTSGDEGRVNPIEELKIQILRIANTVNSKDEVNRR
jgi:hypothetical protein